MPSGGGVFLFTNEGVALKPDLLVSHAQALAVLLTDPNSAPSRPLDRPGFPGPTFSLRRSTPQQSPVHQNGTTPPVALH